MLAHLYLPFAYSRVRSPHYIIQWTPMDTLNLQVIHGEEQARPGYILPGNSVNIPHVLSNVLERLPFKLVRKRVKCCSCSCIRCYSNYTDYDYQRLAEQTSSFLYTQKVKKKFL